MCSSDVCRTRVIIDKVRDMLAHEAIEEFKRLYEKEYGITLSSEEASRRARALINLYREVCVGGSGESKTKSNEI